MLLTISQKYLKELLKDFGALTKTQAEKLLQIKYSPKSFKREIHQLILKNEIKEQDEYILSFNGQISNANITAIDVMLLISDGQIESLHKGNDLFALTFFKMKKRKLWRYDICIVKKGFEPVITSALENINSKYRVIVFLLETPKQQKDLAVACEYCFVWKKKGEYHFYKEKRKFYEI